MMPTLKGATLKGACFYFFSPQKSTSQMLVCVTQLNPRSQYFIVLTNRRIQECQEWKDSMVHPITKKMLAWNEYNIDNMLLLFCINSCMLEKNTNGTKTQPQCSVNFLKHQGGPTLKPFAAPGVQCSWRFAALYQLRRYSYTWGVISLEKWAYLICCALKQKNIKDFYIPVEVYGMLMSDMLCLYIVYIYKYIHIFSCLQYVGSFQDQMQEPRPNSSFILWTTQLKDHLFQSSNVLKYPAMRGGKDETLSSPTNLCCPIFLTTSTHRDLLLALLLDTFWRIIQDVQKVSLSTKKREDSVHQLHEYYKDLWYMWLKQSEIYYINESTSSCCKQSWNRRKRNTGIFCGASSGFSEQHNKSARISADPNTAW